MRNCNPEQTKALIYVITDDYDNDDDGCNDDGDLVIVLTVFGEGTLEDNCGVKCDVLKSE